MDTKSKILFSALLLAILASIYLSYDRTIVRRDFETTQSEEVQPEVVDSNVIEAVESTSTPDTATTTNPIK